ncbi:MAG: ATP-binding cassette domain-containing protein [Tannerella sp.]|jgi:molybdate transport system ATP-binding protein|nr:ATP-binding cassette domain-containing protein [Tannerella sp.]
MNPLTVSVRQAVPQLPELRFREPVAWDIHEDEHWAIVGANGSGKTLLAAILQGRYLLKEGVVRYHMTGEVSNLVKSIAFKDIHSIAGSRNAYYQQRWHATETEEWPTVGDLLAEMPDTCEDIYVRFRIHEFLSRKVIHLSSGEFRKFQIIRTLLSKPAYSYWTTRLSASPPPRAAY